MGMGSLSEVDGAEGKETTTICPQHEERKEPWSSAPLSSAEPRPTSPGPGVGVVFNIAEKRESLLRATSARSRKFPTRAKVTLQLLSLSSHTRLSHHNREGYRAIGRRNNRRPRSTTKPLGGALHPHMKLDHEHSWN
jgi:hypothetical protein